MSLNSCSTMIIGIQCWQFILIMALIVVLLMVPVVSWIIHRRMKKNRKSSTESIPPLMYITTVSGNRTDIDIPHLPTPGEPHFLPPSYEDICNGVKDQSYLTTSTMTLNVDEELPEYSSVSSHRGSMVLSTFYSDNQSTNRMSTSSARSDESDSDSEHEDSSAATSSPSAGQSNRAFEDIVEHEALGVFIA